MWLIKSKKTGKSWCWSNRPTDDFLRFVPKHISTLTAIKHEPEDLEVSLAEDDFAVDCAHKSNAQDVVAGDNCLNIIEPGSNKIIKSVKTKPLKRWPYDGIKFLGHEF